MKIQEFLDKTHPTEKELRPRIICNDGFSMSVQAGKETYSMPSEAGKTGFSSVEIGYLNEEEELLFGIAENEENYTDTIYPYIPVELVNEIINKHGGIDVNETFKDRFKRGTKNG